MEKSATEILEEYKKLTSRNDHTEAGIVLARYFGAEKDVNTLKKIQKAHEDRGYITRDELATRDEISNKYYYRLKGAKKMKTGGDVKQGDYLYSNTGVKVKVLAYSPKFGGRVLIERADGIDGGKPLWRPLSKFTDKAMHNKGGGLKGKYAEDISSVKKLISDFLKKYSTPFSFNEKKALSNVEAKDYLGRGAELFVSFPVKSNIGDKLNVGQTKPRYGYLWLSSDINPNGITSKEDIGRTYVIHLEIKGRKRVTQRTYDDGGIYFKIYEYGRSIEDVLSKVNEAISKLNDKMSKDEISFEFYSYGSKFSVGGGVRKKVSSNYAVVDDDSDRIYVKNTDKNFIEKKHKELKEVYPNSKLSIVKFNTGGGVGETQWKVEGFVTDENGEKHKVNITVSANNIGEAKENAISEFEDKSGVSVDGHNLFAEQIMKTGGNAGKNGYRVSWLEDGQLEKEEFKKEKEAVDYYNTIVSEKFYYTKPVAVVERISDGKVIKGKVFEYSKGGNTPSKWCYEIGGL